MPGCIVESACNYSNQANVDDGTCLYFDAIEVCGGTCEADLDGDGICDNLDDCVGAFDVCGICNGPGAIYQCGCDDIPAGDCDCDGTALDALGYCGGDCFADWDGDGVCDAFGCLVESACNYNGSRVDNGTCLYFDAISVCGGTCQADVDADGICDDVDDCVGAYDECGVCNGPGAIYECGCEDIPAGDCDCNGNQLDACGICTYPQFSNCFGCMDPLACNYEPDASIPIECISCQSQPNGTQLLYIDTTWVPLDDVLGPWYPVTEVFYCCCGCTDILALNYDEFATTDNGLCHMEGAQTPRHATSILAPQKTTDLVKNSTCVAFVVVRGSPKTLAIAMGTCWTC